MDKAPCLGGKLFVYTSEKIHLSLLLGPCRLVRSLGALPSTLGFSSPNPVRSVPLTILKPAATAPSQLFFLLQRCSHTITMAFTGLSGFNCEDHLVFKSCILQEKRNDAFRLNKSQLYFLNAIIRSMLWDSSASIK